MKKTSLDKYINKMLNEEETFLLSFIILAHMREDDKYKSISELIYLFDSYKGFKEFIKYYQGTTINVPELKEVKQALRLLELFQNVRIDKRDFDECYEKLKLSSLGLDKGYCKLEIERFEKFLHTNGEDVLKQLRRLSK